MAEKQNPLTRFTRREFLGLAAVTILQSCGENNTQPTPTETPIPATFSIETAGDPNVQEKLYANGRTVTIEGSGVHFQAAPTSTNTTIHYNTEVPRTTPEQETVLARLVTLTGRDPQNSVICIITDDSPAGTRIQTDPSVTIPSEKFQGFVGKFVKVDFRDATTSTIEQLIVFKIDDLLPHPPTM